MPPRMPTELDMGQRPAPSPSLGIAGYRGDVPNLEAPGQALMALGSEAAREFAIYQEKADTVRVEDAWNQYKNAALELTHGPKGVLTLKAGNAVNGNILQTAETGLAEARKRIMEGLSSEEQRVRFKARADATDLQVKQQTLQHLEAEHREYAKSVIMGSEAAARAQILAAPESQDVFNGARDTLFRQADAYLEAQGTTDPAAKQAYKDKINDALWTARIDALVYDKPLLAEAMFRANQKEIKNPEVRLVLQNKTREVALAVDSDMSAEKIIQDFRTKNPPVAASPITNVAETARILELTKKENLTAKERAEITAYFNRVRPGGGKITEDEIATLPAAMTSVDPMAQNTSGLPLARDIAAQLPLMQTNVEKMATEKFGPDVANPDRAAWVRRTTAALHAKVSKEVESLNAIQRQAQGALIDAIVGAGPFTAGTPGITQTGGAGSSAQARRLTSFAEIQSNPELLRWWQQLDPGVKPAMINLMAKNIEMAKPGDAAKYRELYDRILLPPEDPRKIHFAAQIIDPAVAKDLSIEQIEHLQRTLRQQETDGGRGWNAQRRSSDQMAEGFFKSAMLLTSQPDKQIQAIMAWRDDVSKKIDEYAKAGKDPSTLFQLKTPDSMVGPEKWAPYVSAALGANTMGKDAAAVAAGTKAPIAGPPPAVQPATIDTREKLTTWLQSLPPEVTTFKGTDGNVYRVPGRAPAAPSATVAATPEPGSAVVAPAAMTPTGKVVPAAPAKPKGETPEFGGSINDMPPEYTAKHVTELNLEAVKYAATETGKAALFALNPLNAGRKALDLYYAGIEALKELPTAARRESARAYFEDIMKKDRFFKEDIPAIREALKYGDLSAADRKRAKAMLKAAGEKE